MSPDTIQGRLNGMYEEGKYIVVTEADCGINDELEIECSSHGSVGEYKLQNILYKNTIPCKRCSREQDRRFVPTASVSGDAYKVEGTIWEAYVPELLEMKVEFPKLHGHTIFVHKVELDDLGQTCKRFFFGHGKSGEVYVVGEGVSFPSPREAIDWLKGPQCTREYIIHKQEMERVLNAE